MNTDNTNLENNIGTESFGMPQAPEAPAPVNNVGEETFSPFQDLNSTPLNVPTENPVDQTTTTVDFNQPAPVENVSAPAPEAYTETPASNVDALNGMLNPEPVIEQPAAVEPAPVAPVVDSFQPAPTEPVMDTYQATPTEPVANTFEATQSVPTIDTYDQNPIPEPAPVSEPVENTPKMEVYVQPQNVEPAIEEPAAPAAGMGLNDYVTQNTTQMQTVNESTVAGPAIPIPDQMPTTDYQAEVSTPVDYATPMSDFDQIGTTPELDPNAKPKKSKKGLLAILLVLVIAGLGYAAYYFINVKGIFNSDSVTVKEVTAEKGEALSVNIDDYASFKNTSSSNCSLDTTKVNTGEVGTYNFTVTCGDKSYTGKVTVKDTKGPEITVKTWVIASGQSLTPDMLVDGKDEEATFQYGSETEAEAFKTAGLKTVKLIATDSLNNSKTYLVPVIVTSYEYSMGIVAKKDVTGDNTDALITEKDVILYNNSAGIINDTSYTAYVINFNNDVSYKAAIANYDGSGTMTYETYTGIPVLYSTTNTIVLVKDINSELIKEDYNTTYTNLKGVNGYDAFVINQIGTNKELIEFNR